MAQVRHLTANDVSEVVERIATRLEHDAAVRPLINPVVDIDVLAHSLHGAAHQTWVAERAGHIIGHLYGTLLDDDEYGRGVWVGPDAVSYDDVDVLAELYAHAGATWLDAGAREHYVWSVDDAASNEAWMEMGFARMHRRGTMALHGARRRPPPPGYELRRGRPDDLDVALALDGALDEAQSRGPSFLLNAHRSTSREAMRESLSDPDVHHFVVEHHGRGVAQCLTFALPTRRGSFDRTVHLSAVSVAPGHRDHGVGTALVDFALAAAVDRGFEYAETNWRVTNHRAQRHWLRYGFTPTYTRLHRAIGER